MKIVIVGLGVIGGSFALALKQAGYDDVYGVDTNAETLEKAEKMGIIRKRMPRRGRHFSRRRISSSWRSIPSLSARLWSKTRRCSKKGAL